MAAVTTNVDGAEAPEDGAGSPPPASEPETASATQGHACNVAFCPIGLAISAVQPLRPDAVEHLLVAGRELFLAMRTIVDARADQLDGSEGPDTSFEKIEIG
jgi:hypothetical protein